MCEASFAERGQEAAGRTPQTLHGDDHFHAVRTMDSAVSCQLRTISSTGNLFSFSAHMAEAGQTLLKFTCLWLKSLCCDLDI